jgi:regulator of sigma E protease
LSSVLSFLILLSILVIAHEWGHFIVARRAGVRVLRFSVGIGPELFGMTRGDTRWAVAAIPFGGYVKFAGEDPEEDADGASDEFLNKSVGARAAIVLAGPLMNYLLAIVIYAVVLFVQGEVVIGTTRIGAVEPGSPAEISGVLPGDRIEAVNGLEVEDWHGFAEALSLVESGEELTLRLGRDGRETALAVPVPEEGGFAKNPLGVAPFMDPVVGFVKKDGPAWRAGIRSGDRIVEVDGVPVDRWTGMREVVQTHPGSELSIRWERDGVGHDARVVPDPLPVLAEAGGAAPPDTVGVIGVQRIVETRRIGPLAALGGGWRQTRWLTEQVLGFLWQMVTGGFSMDMLGGPVRMAQLSGESVRWGIAAYFNYMALISVQLAIFNLLPIPVLDGGQLTLFGIEAVRRRPLSVRQRMILQQAGFALLVTLLLAVTVMDVGRLFG